MAGSVGEVEGLRQLQRDLRRINPDLNKEIRRNLRSLAAPVKADAQALALSEIRNIGPVWSQMRIGAPAGTVYVAPKQKGSKRGPRKRQNLAPLLMERAMLPALDKNQASIVRQFDDLVGNALRENNF